MDRLEGRNPIVEALSRGTRPVRRIWLDERANTDDKIRNLLKLAERQGVVVERVPRRRLDKMAEGRVHNGVIGEADPLPRWSTKALLSHVTDSGRLPFFVLADEIQYEHNLGAILRSSLGFGVDGLVLPTRRGAGLSPIVQRVSMGGVEAVPVVREGLFAAMKQMKRAGIRILGADMGGKPMTHVRMGGAVALVMGGEGRGLSSTLHEHCDEIVSIPLAGQLESLNVSVAAALLMYEKRRQDGWFDRGDAGPSAR